MTYTRGSVTSPGILNSKRGAKVEHVVIEVAVQLVYPGQLISDRRAAAEADAVHAEGVHDIRLLWIRQRAGSGTIFALHDARPSERLATGWGVSIDGDHRDAPSKCAGRAKHLSSVCVTLLHRIMHVKTALLTADHEAGYACVEHLAAEHGPLARCVAEH